MRSFSTSISAPVFNSEMETAYLRSRCETMKHILLPGILPYCVPLLLFFFWDRTLDPDSGLITLYLRIAAVIIMLASAFLARLSRHHTQLLWLIGIMIGAGTISIAASLLLVKQGYVYGYCGLLMFMTLSAYFALDRRHALAIYGPLAGIVMAIMGVAGLHGLLLWSNSVFLLMALVAAVMSAHFLDKTARQRYQIGHYLENIAQHDPLTKLSNRRAVYERSNALISESLIVRKPLAVLMVDIDHFKTINDTYGHEVGDEVLMDVAASISTASRETDVVARWGGEEFLVILPNTSLIDAKFFSERLCLQLSRHPIEAKCGGSIAITVSIGVSGRDGLDNTEAQPLATMISEADKALYFCKRNGRNQVAAYPDLRTEQLVRPAEHHDPAPLRPIPDQVELGPNSLLAKIIS